MLPRLPTNEKAAGRWLGYLADAALESWMGGTEPDQIQLLSNDRELQSFSCFGKTEVVAIDGRSSSESSTA